MIIRELTSSDYDAAVPRLAEILVDAVDSGAGVTFMHPLPQDVAEAYWMKQKADVVEEVVVQVVAGRNIAVLVEAAVRSTILKLRGIDTYQEFVERHRKAMDVKQPARSGA